MEGSRGKAASVSSSSTQSINVNAKSDPALSHSVTPFIFKHGRRYLREPSQHEYPLPCDGPEIHRQNLQTHLATKAFGKALCSPFVEKSPPQRVLDICCGSGYWSSLCHDYLADLGCLNVEFVGLDIAPVAPDLKKQGINWHFVQHDIRKVPLPFDDEEFDLVLMKDLGLCLALGPQQERLFDDAIRILRSGGVLEIWETDYLVRSLLPHPPVPPSKRPEDHDYAIRTATFLISPATPFANSRNKYLTDSNRWIQDALDGRKLSPTPCGRMQPMLLQEPDTLEDIGFRRIAIPFGELKWEREDPARQLRGKGRASSNAGLGSALTAEQADLRSTALLNTVMFIESLEPYLKKVSGKNGEEWRRWWDWMMTDLYQEGGANNGDCIEIGAFWARKI
jgi:SAM-dependent methyltransferase